MMRVQGRRQQWLVDTNCADIKIIFVTDEDCRVRTSFDKEFAEESYVLMITAWEDRLDPLFEGERTRVEPVIPAVEETDEGDCLRYRKNTRGWYLKDPIGFELYDGKGRCFTVISTEIPFRWIPTAA